MGCIALIYLAFVKGAGFLLFINDLHAAVRLFIDNRHQIYFISGVNLQFFQDGLAE